MPNRFIRTDTAAGVLRITFDRPDVLNSFHSAMAAEVIGALDQAAEDEAVRAVLLTGSGRAFCAGQDLDEARPRDDGSVPDFVAHLEATYNPIVRRIRALEKPVVAAVNGVAAGAGANMALACDFVVASEQASFIQAFSRIGLVPDTGGTWFLPRLVGLARATALMMTGEKVTAEQAQAMGMIYRVVSPEELMTQATALAEQLATMATRGLGLTKRLLNASATNDLEAQLAMEATLQGEAGHSRDYTEGVNAFLDKRPPLFKGH